MGRKLKAEQDKQADTIAEIKTLAEEANVPKSADEMLKLYSGREAELLNCLRKLEANQSKQSETVDEIRALVSELNIPKSADDMLKTYEGREEALLKNLKKMKASNASPTASSPTSSASLEKKKSYNQLIKEKQAMKKQQQVLTQ